ncbi:type I phosphomannose isomerase catalytic subunit [Polaribacter tangerinus]|uniref:type I phosphomannose isomerase catalytic subunit n=1 Tax=Polaribacter tangerinus TaxID=1920034 RepID=UPI000B4A9A52|nr:type I phosphomannose isomerase catalytic subunit [Polaribacter tangerinus]
MQLYPLKFTPLFKYRLWGGNKLKNLLNKEYSQDNIGESWEISTVKDDKTLVSNGVYKGENLTNLISEFKSAIVGKAVYKKFGNEFPLLIKFIDAKTPLSIQVHPNDEVAKQRHHSFGKNEMWYIMEADDNAELIVGFDKELQKEEYQSIIKNDDILDVLHHDKVSEGDTYFIPAGRVHAIGAGVLLAEIQQTSDVTYRIYDYNRIDAKTGKLRDLHNDLATDVIDFKTQSSYKTSYNKFENISNKLVHSPYFKTNFIKLHNSVQKDYSSLDSFVIYICVSGEVVLNHNNNNFDVKRGETILLPAAINSVKLTSKTPQSKIIEVYL